MVVDVSGLGSNIELSGFKDIDEAAMAVLRRIVQSYVKRFDELCYSFEKLSLKMKKVHVQVHSEKYEIHALVIDKGRAYASTTTDKDLFAALDAALKKVEHELGDK